MIGPQLSQKIKIIKVIGSHMWPLILALWPIRDANSVNLTQIQILISLDEP